MRHNVDGRKFGRNTSARVAMLKSMANNLIHHEHMITTVEKAKEVRRVVDRLITLAKKNDLHSRRRAFDKTRDRDVVVKLFGSLGPRYATRNGGYTRVLRVDGTRLGDGAEMALIELVDRPIVEKKKKAKVAKANPAGEQEQAPAKKAPKVAKAAKTDDSKAKATGADKGKSKTTTVRKSSSRGSGNS